MTNPGRHPGGRTCNDIAQLVIATMSAVTVGIIIGLTVAVWIVAP